VERAAGPVAALALPAFITASTSMLIPVAPVDCSFFTVLAIQAARTVAFGAPESSGPPIASAIVAPLDAACWIRSAERSSPYVATVWMRSQGQSGQAEVLPWYEPWTESRDSQSAWRTGTRPNR
jgi:hypothetical protein